MNPVIIASGPSIPVAPDPDPHAEARITEPVIRLGDDRDHKRDVERLLSPAERLRFRALWREARRNGHGVKSAIRAALRRQIAETTERLEKALERVGRP